MLEKRGENGRKGAHDYAGARVLDMTRRLHCHVEVEEMESVGISLLGVVEKGGVSPP